MMRRASAAAAFFVMALASHDVLAQSQPFVVAPPGTRFYTSGGNWHEIDSVEGTLVRTVSNALATREWLGFCLWHSRQTQIDKPAADPLWPLAAGKSVSLERGRGERGWTTTLKVIGTEQLKVPAGTFSTWIIEADEVGVTQKSQTITRCWYAPEVGVIVKRQVEVKEGSGRGSGYEVIKIDRRDRSKIAEFRPPAPGTAFETTIGTFRIDGSEGTNLIQKGDKPHSTQTWVGGLVRYESDEYVVDSRTREFAKLWPLEIGKSIAFDTDRSSSTVRNNTLKVEKTEVIEVPAGTFATFVIKRQERSINTSFNAIYTYWWSPALGFPIKREVQFIAGKGTPSNYELRAAKPPAK